MAESDDADAEFAQALAQPDPTADHWDSYLAAYGELQIHFHKLDNAVIRKIDRLVQDCVRRGSAMTREELADTGYRHPLDGQFY